MTDFLGISKQVLIRDTIFLGVFYLMVTFLNNWKIDVPFFIGALIGLFILEVIVYLIISRLQPKLSKSNKNKSKQSKSSKKKSKN